MFGFFEKTYTPDKDIPDLSGKVILVTGGNTGLGKETIRQLAKHNPAQIFMAARTPSKAHAAIAELQATQANANITFLELDLTDLTSVASAAKTFLSQSTRLDLLINNAGVMALPYSTTSQGYEIQFGTNHIGHALLTKLLLPTLVQTAEANADSDVRIVNLSSIGMQFAPSGGLVLDQSALESHSTWVRYGQSKLANALHAAGLKKRYPSITAVAVHPGVILTDLFKSSQESNFIVRWGMWAVGGFVMSDVAHGALNQLWAATAPREEVEKSVYFLPVGKANKGTAYAADEGLADRLWEWTEGELERHGY